jgi:biopolymer transport protein ExbB
VQFVFDLPLAVLGGFDWFLKGGWAMWPLLALSIWTLFVIFSRSAHYASYIPKLNRELDNIARGQALPPERLEGDLAPLLSRALREGRINTSRAELAVEHEMQGAAKMVNSLDTVSQAAPMFGLIGTVSGMIKAFSDVTNLQGAGISATLASGISEALIATLTGLAVAIPAFLAFRYFRSRLMAWETHLYTVIDDVKQLIATAGASAGAGAAVTPPAPDIGGKR